MDIILDNIQEIALERMLEHKRYCLFWDVGVGKTYPVLARLAKFEESLKILILAPAVSINNMWENEKDADWFGVFEQHDVEMHSFEWFAWNKGEWYITFDGKKKRRIVEENRSKLNHKFYDVIIIDEAQRLAASRNQSRSARIISKLTSTASYVYCLTGTPARNGYQDLYPLFKNAGIHVWPDMSYDDFLHYYFKGYNLNLPYGTVFKPTEIKERYIDEFFNAIAPYCMFAQKDRDYKVEVIDIDIAPTKTDSYFKALRGIYTDAAGNEQTTNQLVGFGKAYMLLNGFEYVLVEDGNNQTVEYFENPKIPYLLDIIEKELVTHKCMIVAYNFKRDFKNLTAVFKMNGIEWTDDIAEAQGKTGKFVYLLQLKRGISINLQGLTSVIIFYTYNFSYVDYDQSIGRIDRRGQTNTVKIYRLMFPQSIEKNIILRAIDTKQRIDYTLKTKAAHRIISKEIANHGYTGF